MKVDHAHLFEAKVKIHVDLTINSALFRNDTEYPKNLRTNPSDSTQSSDNLDGDEKQKLVE